MSETCLHRSRRSRAWAPLSRQRAGQSLQSSSKQAEVPGPGVALGLGSNSPASLLSLSLPCLASPLPSVPVSPLSRSPPSFPSLPLPPLLPPALSFPQFFLLPPLPTFPFSFLLCLSSPSFPEWGEPPPSPWMTLPGYPSWAVDSSSLATHSAPGGTVLFCLQSPPVMLTRLPLTTGAVRDGNTIPLDLEESRAQRGQ